MLDYLAAAEPNKKRSWSSVRSCRKTAGKRRRAAFSACWPVASLPQDRSFLRHLCM